MLNILLDGKPFSVVDIYPQIDHLAETAGVDRYRLTVDPENFPDLKKRKLEQINYEADAVLDEIISTYPRVELLTWALQKGEAEAYRRNPTDARTPLLLVMAAKRNISIAEMIRKVEIKTGYFIEIAGAVLGQRQAYEDQLELAETEAAIMAVPTTIELPE